MNFNSTRRKIAIASPNFSPRVEPTRRDPVASAQVGVMGARSEPMIRVWGRREITL